MTVRIFYSYSHKDKNHKGDLEKRLKTLQQNRTISSWSDREILPGGHIPPEIRTQMKKANIILLLLSSDFLSSESCQKEIKMALQFKRKNKVTIIPIILRDCPWKDNTDLAGLKALPEDGKPVVNWPSIDSAWLDVYEGIKKQVEQIQNDVKPTIKDDFKKRLLENPTRNEPLNERFIYPDIINNNIASKQLENNEMNSKKLVKLDNFNNPYILLEGDDQCGKTALSSMLFLEYLNSGLYPVCIESSKISKHAGFIKIIEKGYKNQYNNWQTCISLPKDKRILFIDDIDDSNKNNEAFYKFVSSIKDHFKGAIILTSPSMSLSIRKSKYNAFSYFQNYSIMPFGHKKRNELVKKYISLDEKVEFDINDNCHVKTMDQYTQYIDVIIGSNIVPGYPVFILAILDSIRLMRLNQDIQKTSYGHCYHAMITMLLYKINVKPEEYDSYFNFLTQLAYWMFNKNLKNISDSQLDEFLNSYDEKYIMPRKEIIDDILIKAHIIKVKDKLYSFKYIYVYYYFVAKYLSESIESGNNEKTIKKLIDEVYLKDNSNILIFLTHHTKNKKLIKDISSNTDNILKEYDEATLSGDEKEFIKNLQEALKNFQLPDSSHSIDEERDRQLKDKDKSSIDSKVEQTKPNKQDEDILWNEIEKSIKKMEIIGQILRNQYGSLEKKQLKNLFHRAQNVGLRLMKDFMETMLGKREIIENLVKKIVGTKDEALPPEQVERISKLIVDQMSYSILFGLLHKIVYSIGYDKIIDIADEVNQENDTVASKLINLYIHTWYKKTLNVKKIASLHKEFKDDKNYQAIYILKHIVVRHIYMHHVHYKDKQRIANLLGFSMKNQILAQEKLK